MKIIVNSMGGGKIELEVFETTSVLDIKNKLVPFTGLDIEQQALLYNGKRLKEGETVEQLKIKEKSMISLVISLRGG